MVHDIKSTTGPDLSYSGFSMAEGVLSYRECDHLIGELSAPSMKRSRAGARHLMGHPAVAALASDSRLLELARLAVGMGATPYRATLFEKSARANWLVVWHQ